MHAWIRKALNAFIGFMVFIIVALVTGELVLRLLPPTLVGDLGPRKINVEFHDFGPWFVPNQRTSFTTHCHSAAPISINSFGMRDEERSLAKAENVVRVSVLGDSFMEALQVADGKYTTALLQDRLNKTGRRVEVLNFGFSGYGTAQQLHLYRAMVRQFKSDYVLVFFLPGNDVQNNYMKLDYAANGLSLDDYGSTNVVPFAYFDRVGDTLVPKPNIRINKPIKRFFKQHLLHRFYIVDYLYGRFLYFRAYAASLELYSGPDNEEVQNAVKSKSNDTQEPDPAVKSNDGQKKDPDKRNKDWEEAWKLTELIFLKLREEVEADGAQLGVVIIDQDEEKYRRMISLAEKIDLPYLALGQPLKELSQQYGLTSGDLIFDGCDAHWNANGHRLATEATAEWLGPMLDAGGFR